MRSPDCSHPACGRRLFASPGGEGDSLGRLASITGTLRASAVGASVNAGIATHKRAALDPMFHGETWPRVQGFCLIRWIVNSAGILPAGLLSAFNVLISIMQPEAEFVLLPMSFGDEITHLCACSILVTLVQRNPHCKMVTWSKPLALGLRKLPSRRWDVTTPTPPTSWWQPQAGLKPPLVLLHRLGAKRLPGLSGPFPERTPVVFAGPQDDGFVM